jgi:hypothetical protein
MEHIGDQEKTSMESIYKALIIHRALEEVSVCSRAKITGEASSLRGLYCRKEIRM